MASVRLEKKTTKNPINLYVRFNIKINNVRRDLFAKSGILIKEKWWSNKKQNFNTVSDKFPRKELKSKIENLKDFIVETYNESYSEGEIINKQWLEETIRKFHKQVKEGDANYKIYFVDFAKKNVEESKDRINISTGKKISKRTIQKYLTTISRLEEFETKNGTRLKLKDINLKFHRSFVSFLKIDGNYGNSTVEKYISQVKTFCREAESKGYDVNHEYKSKRFTFKRQQPLDPYLTESEIKSIIDLDIKDDRLDKIRDLFVIGLFTGLRVSDFKDYERLNIIENNFEILATKKTDKPVKIPIHHNIKKILKKRNGKLPKFKIAPTTLEIVFNEGIKKICFTAGITKKILGDKMDKETKRDIRGFYPKYQLVSSHICRRSFVTNHYGRIPNQAIMAITTHATEKQLLEYVKISNDEHIETVRKLWDEEEKNLNQNSSFLAQ